jgi:hypothetical protein
VKLADVKKLEAKGRAAKKYGPEVTRMPKTRIVTSIGIIAIAIVLGISVAGYLWFGWPPVAIFYFIFFGMAVIGIPVGIKYGTQKKDYFWP